MTETTSAPSSVLGAESPAATGCSENPQGTVLGEAPAENKALLDSAIKGGVDYDGLVAARLGVSAGLFAALRVRHFPTAVHSLRVALMCSAWAKWREMAEEDQRELEVAALLHDVGLIGLPDQILLKPGPLSAEEILYVDRARLMSVEILRRVTDNQNILRIVENVPAWFDASRAGYSAWGRAIPLASRMIAIVEAFDAMTTDHLYRPAMSVERAIAELYRAAGRQFDPELVQEFVDFYQRGLEAVKDEVARGWLVDLDPEAVNHLWRWVSPTQTILPPELETVFQHRLLQNMRDGVIFIDTQELILQWNPGAERLSGIMAEAVRSRKWSPTILGLRSERGQPLGEADCPVLTALRCGTQVLRRLTMLGRNQEPVPVDVHAAPVVLQDGTILGVVVIIHDASPEISLEQRLEYFRERVTRDPLTDLANRAEFDRMLPLFVEQYHRRGIPFSLMICDLDRFKQVNDTFGHQAGDDAIRTLAAILRRFSRSGDLVARYGGEEFVMVCAACDIATATRRAEEIRQALAQTPQPRLAGRVVTASFGVTEVQPGDTPETILRRADRALLMAKSKGRNTVVQLGVGNHGDGPQPVARRSWWGRTTSDTVVRQTLFSPIPLSLAIEKLHGFIADHQARIVKVQGNHLELEIEAKNPLRTRRRSDRPVFFTMQIAMGEERPAREGGAVRSRFEITVWPTTGRERRRRELAARLEEILVSFRSYLSITERDEAGLPSDGRTWRSWLPTGWWRRLGEAVKGRSRRLWGEA